MPCLPAAFLQEHARRVPSGSPIRAHPTQDDRKLCLAVASRVIRDVLFVGAGDAKTVDEATASRAAS